MAAMSIHTEDFSEGFDAAPARKPRAKAKPAGADVAESSMRSPTISPAPVNKHEEALERALRPKLLDEYVGQAKAREMGLYMQKYCGCIFSEEDRYSTKIEKAKKRYAEE